MPCGSGGLHDWIEREIHRDREQLAGILFEPFLGRNYSAQTINENVRINKVHRAGLFHPSDRNFRANSKLSLLSARSRHIPMNSEFNRSLKVAEVGSAEGEMVITTAADPVGTSAGNVMRSSLLAGMSVLRVTVFTIGTSPHSSPYQNQWTFTTTLGGAANPESVRDRCAVRSISRLGSARNAFGREAQSLASRRLCSLHG